MNFEIKLPPGITFKTLAAAGLHINEYLHWDTDVDVRPKKAQLPVEFSCRYFLSDKPVNARLTVLGREPATHLRLEVADAVIGNRIRKFVNRYSVVNKGEAVEKREHKQVWAQIEKILKRDKLSYDKLCNGAALPRRAMAALMELCQRTERQRWETIHGLFTDDVVAKADRAFAAKWLITLFEAERDPDEQIGMRLWDLAVPEVADDLIRLIRNPLYGGDRRGPLCLALAKIKHPQAGKVIASVLDDEDVTRWAIQALGQLKAREQAKAVRKFLRHANADVRREAKRTLKKLGLPVETTPPPVHLVENRRLLPKGLKEWSTNLDIENLKPTLETLAKCVERGFGDQEIAEVDGVADEMKHNQTRAFRFPIVAQGKKSELWLVIFMDDLDSPDLEIHSSPELIQKLEKLLPD